MYRVASSLLSAAVLVAVCITPPNVLAAKGGKGNGNGGGPGGGGSGGAPASIENITTDAISNAASLSWIVPEPPAGGSDVHHYEVRFSTSQLDADNFSTLGEPAARTDEFLASGPGQVEYFTVRDLIVDTTYYFGVRAISSRGDVSELTTGSFVSSQTARTASDYGLWEVDEVTELADDSTFGCCKSMSAQFDSVGSPTVAWTRGFPDEVRFAYRDNLGNWTTEIAFAGTNCLACSMGQIQGFRFKPAGAPGASTPDTPALLFRHMDQVGNKRKGNSVGESLVYAYRRATNDWVAEEVVRGNARENGGIDGYPNRFAMDHFWNSQTETWVPTAAYITSPLYEDPITVSELVFSERAESPGQAGQWIPISIASCNAAEARFLEVRLQRGADGSLHAMVQTANDNAVWVTLLHRPSSGDSDSIQYWQSDLFVGEAFNVDGNGNYYVAGRVDWDGDDLEIIESTRGAFESIPAEAVCSAPTTPQGGIEIVELAKETDTFANGVVEGELIGGQPWSGGWGLELTGDDGVTAPAVHIFKRRHSGNYELNELRMFSRCYPGAGWIWDAVDRPHASEDWRNVAVSDSAMAWAYNYGAVYGGHYESFPQDQMFVAERTGNACQL